MKRILKLVEKRTSEKMETHPFISWLSSGNLPAIQKLKSWLPCLAFFAMSFKDYNNLVLKYPDDEAADDPLKAAINEHAHEDGNHWRWFLKDLKTLDANKDIDFASLLNFLWGKDTEMQRNDLTVLSHKAQDPRLRFCLISAFEKCGHVVIGAAARLGMEIEKESGMKLYYLGKTHLDHEEGHLQLSPVKMDLEQEAWRMELSDEMYEKAVEIVEEVFTINYKRWDAYLDFVNGPNSWEW